MSDKKVIVNVRAVKPNDVDTFINLYIQSYKGLEEYAYTTKRDIRDGCLSVTQMVFSLSN
ncbi:MAG: hypothetical protein QW782_05655 [Candidatus Bathyarchaeia archaeon]